MASLTDEAQQIIERNRLGSPLSIYGPHTISSIIGGLFLLIFSVFWTWFALSITGSPLLPHNLSIITLLFQPTPSPFSYNPPGITENTPFTTFSNIFSLVGIFFSFFGLLFFFLGLWLIVSAIYNRGMRAVVCTYGLAFVKPSGSTSFYWQDVLTGFLKVRVTTSTSYNQTTGMATTSTSLRHIYTVHCHDGRKFVLKSPLARVQNLAEDIEVQTARMKHMQSQSRSY